MSPLWAVLRHEMLLQRRQLRTVLTLVMLAVGMGPAGLIALDRYNGVQESSSSSATKTTDLAVSADFSLEGWFIPSDHLVIVAGPATTDNTLEGTESYGHLTREGDVVTLHRALEVSRARPLMERLRDVVRRNNREGLNAARVSVGEAPLGLTIKTATRDSARADGDIAGRYLPASLVFLLFSMALYVAIDVITKEKEKGTAETLLTTAVDRKHLLLGKALVVFGLTFATGTAWLVSLALVEALGLLQVPSLFKAAVFTLPNVLALWLVVALGSLQIGSLAMVVAAKADDYRAASILTLPVMMLVFAPLGLAGLPTAALTPFTALVPIMNFALGVRGVMAGELDPVLGALAVLTSTLYAGLAVAMVAWILDRNDPLDKGLDAETRRGSGDFGPDAFVVLTAALLFMLVVGVPAQALHPMGGLAFTMVGVCAGSALGGLAFFGAPWRKTLSWRAPGTSNTLWAIVMGLGMPGVGQLVAQLCAPILPMPDQVVQNLQLLTETPLPLLLLVGAVGPAICEELLFRGTLLGMFRTRYSDGMALGLSAVCFGVFHLDLARMPITGVLGLVIGWTVLRTGSIVPGMIIHFLNNALAFLAAVWLADVTPAGWMVVLPFVLALVSLGAVTQLRPAPTA